jgi:hypothetical protein
LVLVELFLLAKIVGRDNSIKLILNFLTMNTFKLIKFRRGTTPLNEIIGKAEKLGLRTTPCFIGADCCVVNSSEVLFFAEIGSPSWNSEKHEEITEEDFMNMDPKH